MNSYSKKGMRVIAMVHATTVYETITMLNYTPFSTGGSVWISLVYL